MKEAIETLNNEVISCKKCPRLVRWREKIAGEKVARFSNWIYWGKPVTGFGDLNGRLIVIGLAPAAHGANRTGRMFTGDRSGEWLYRTLYKYGFASQPVSYSKNDSLQLYNCYVTAIVRCAPPENKPTPKEIQNCNPFLTRELKLLSNLKVIVTLGRMAFDSTIKTIRKLNLTNRIKFPYFSHGLIFPINDRITIIASYHPSQQNTFTGKLTAPMFDSIFASAAQILNK
ncbi:MAG: uracil-DNA glycosylase [Candidatus Kryptoniota bacterium]